MIINDEQLILNYINENKILFTISNNEKCMGNAIAFFSLYPKLYPVLDDIVKYEIKKYGKQGYTLIKWFIIGDLKRHFEKIKDEIDTNERIHPIWFEWMYKICNNQGEISAFCEFIIWYYGQCNDFTTNKIRYLEIIKPYLKYFNSINFIQLIGAINTNKQIHDYYNQKEYNNEIFENAKKCLPENFDYNKYENFKYNIEDIIEEDEFIILSEDDLPF